MSYTLSIKYSDAMIRLAARYFLRRFLLPEVVLGGVAIVLAFGLYAAGFLSLTLTLAFSGAGIALIVVAGSVAWQYVRKARRKFAALGEPRVEWIFSETTFGTTSDLGAVEAPWSTVKKVWQFPGVWLLFFEGGGYSTLPTGQLDPELQTFILQRLKR
jgi:hypothetical protein